jgi:hypothetical protein
MSTRRIVSVAACYLGPDHLPCSQQVDGAEVLTTDGAFFIADSTAGFHVIAAGAVTPKGPALSVWSTWPEAINAIIHREETTS